MTIVDDLAKRLAAAYNGAAKSEKVVQIHLFGIQHASVLGSVSLPDLLGRAGMPASYKTELRNGMRLSRFVSLK